MKRLIVVALALVALTACGPSDSSFEIKATLNHAGEKSVTVSQVEVISAVGRADGWFHGTHQIHDNCDCGSWGNNQTYGHVFDAQGTEISLADLTPGQKVHILGGIRTQHEMCGKNPCDEYRPVFERVEVIPQ